MPEARFNFPRGFLWGTSSSAYQVEGNSKNNQWYLWEKEAGRIAEGGTCGQACDWWGGRWREDFDRAAEGGQNALRLSFEWSRIQPAPDRWDEHALDHYIDLLRGLDRRGLFPLVTLILCFLHAFIKIRDRCKRMADYAEIKHRVWEAYHAADPDTFKRKIAELKAWTLQTLPHGAGRESILKLCHKAIINKPKAMLYPRATVM